MRSSRRVSRHRHWNPISGRFEYAEGYQVEPRRRPGAKWPEGRLILPARYSHCTSSKNPTRPQKMLLAALPPVYLGRECVAAVEDSDGVRIEFADGSQARADVLIGADGIHSVIQMVVGIKPEPVSEGIMAYRGLIPAARLDGIYDMGLWSLWVGPGQSFLTYPVSGGEMLNVVAFVSTDLDVEESWSAPGEVAALAAAYNGWDKQVRQVIEAIDHTFRWGIYDRTPLKTWSTDRITLLGEPGRRGDTAPGPGGQPGGRGRNHARRAAPGRTNAHDRVLVTAGRHRANRSGRHQGQAEKPRLPQGKTRQHGPYCWNAVAADHTTRDRRA